MNHCEQAFSSEMLQRKNGQTQAAETNDINHSDESFLIDNQCVICFNEFDKGDEIGWSESCNHIFHRDCIYVWLLKHPECPCCRRKFFNIPEKDEEKSSSRVGTEDIDIEIGNIRAQRDSIERIPSSNRNSLAAEYMDQAMDSTV